MSDYTWWFTCRCCGCVFSAYETDFEEDRDGQYVPCPECDEPVGIE